MFDTFARSLLVALALLAAFALAACSGPMPSTSTDDPTPDDPPSDESTSDSADTPPLPELPPLIAPFFVEGTEWRYTVRTNAYEFGAPEDGLTFIERERRCVIAEVWYDPALAADTVISDVQCDDGEGLKDSGLWYATPNAIWRTGGWYIEDSADWIDFPKEHQNPLFEVPVETYPQRDKYMQNSQDWGHKSLTQPEPGVYCYASRSETVEGLVDEWSVCLKEGVGMTYAINKMTLGEIPTVTEFTLIPD